MSRRRREIRWSMEAKGLVAEHLAIRRKTSEDPSSEHVAARDLVSRLVDLTGNPRDACFRFARRLGMKGRQVYEGWSEAEQEQLLDFIVLNPPSEVAKIMGRSTFSIRSMLHKLGTSAQTARNWFTKFSLAHALHTRADEVQEWIDLGWLKARVVDTGRLKKVIIDPDDFAQFCRQCRNVVMGRRFNAERLDFLQSFIFSPGHEESRPGNNTSEKGGALGTEIEASTKAKECQESASSCNITA